MRLPIHPNRRKSPPSCHPERSDEGAKSKDLRISVYPYTQIDAKSTNSVILSAASAESKDLRTSVKICTEIGAKILRLAPLAQDDKYDSAEQKSPKSVILSGATKQRSRRIFAPKASTMKGVCAVYFVYILSNWDDSVLYIGSTSNLPRRLYEHRNRLVDGFTKKYNVHKLVYYEYTSDVRSAISRERQLKGWSRVKKNALISKMNPSWSDLSENWE